MTTSGWQRFEVTVNDWVAVVTMNRPPVNAIDRTFREEIPRVFDELSERKDVRAVVLTGAGRAFSAGADIRERSAMDTQPGAYPEHNRVAREALYSIMECEKPIIAAINGPAIGMGLGLALSSDILVASEAAVVAMTEVEVGLAGGVRGVMRHFRHSDARLLILAARRFTGAELYRMGVVSACVAPEALIDTAMGIAREIAEKSPLAVRAAKISFNVTENMTFRDGYRFEQDATVALSQTEDTKEAQRAFAEKRKPVFKGR
jgi:enoyl-CoA hydratase/carnithine racemase